jgi:hypothetical protein
VVAYGLDRIDPERDIRIVLIEAGDRVLPGLPDRSLGQVEVPATALWDAQTQRSLQHFSIGQDLIPREMIPAYAILKRAAAAANRAPQRVPNSADRAGGF